MREDRQERWRMRKPGCIIIAKNHRLNAAEDSCECYAKSDEKKWSCPGMISHGSRKNKKFAGEHAERRHAKNCQRSQQEPPADGGAGGDEAANTIHLLRAGLLRGM